jgi:MFS family permease
MRLRDSLKLLPRDFWILTFATLINRMGTMVVPFLPLYLVSVLHFTPAESGSILGIYGAGSLAAGLLGGWLSDRLGAPPLMIGSLFLSAALLFLYPFATNYLPVALLTVGLAITIEGFRPAAMASVGDLVSSEHRKTAFSVNRWAINVGMSVGPAVGGLLAAHSYRGLFIIDGVTSLLAVAVLLAMKRDRTKAPAGASPWPFRAMREAFSDRALVWLCVLLLPLWVVFFQHETTLGVFMTNDLKMNTTIYGLIFTVNTLLVVLFEIPLIHATRHWPARTSLICGGLLTAVGFGILAFVTSVFGLFVSVALWTFGEMLLVPASSAYVSDISPPASRGIYMGVASMSFSLAYILAASAGTAVYGYLGPTALWVGMFVLGSLAAAAMLKLKPVVISEPRRATTEPSVGKKT